MHVHIKKQLLTFGFCALIVTAAMAQGPAHISLQALLQSLASNNDLLQSYASQVQAKKAAVKQAAADRIPQLNTIYQGTVGTDNNVSGPYLSMGILPSVTSGVRAYSDLSAASGNTALVGVNWEAVNFGGYKAEKDFAKSDLAVQNDILARSQYDLSGLAAAYYLEIIKQYELELINQDNVLRLQQLLTSVNSLVTNGIRPGVDTAIASAELSKSLISLYESQKVLAQTQVQIATLTRLPPATIVVDTAAEAKLIYSGEAFALHAVIDTQHHPDIVFYSSLYDLSRAQINLDKNRFYPRIFLDADATSRASSLNSADDYGNLSQGFVPQRFDYFIGLTLTYDIMNIVHKRLATNISRYQAEASAHRLQQAKDDINNSFQQALLESNYQLKRLDETGRELHSATLAYRQQANLYQNGLSSIIDLDIALSYYIQAQRDYTDAKVSYMRSVLNYALVTNTFNTLVQTLNL
jgi:adhesin transport system outer membrane protein